MRFFLISLMLIISLSTLIGKEEKITLKMKGKVEPKFYPTYVNNNDRNISLERNEEGIIVNAP